MSSLVSRFDSVACQGSLEGKFDVKKIFSLDALERRASKLLQGLDRALNLHLDFGGRVVHFKSEDPELPPEILGSRHSPQKLVKAWNGFERTASEISKTFIQSVLGTLATPYYFRIRSD